MFKVSEHRTYNDARTETAHIYFGTEQAAEEYVSLTYKKYIRLTSRDAYVVQELDIVEVPNEDRFNII
tara:strand:+ start:2932 stop:3135 length:204 start_codon:yes stop_codon:yes gene_type:complete